MPQPLQAARVHLFGLGENSNEVADSSMLGEKGAFLEWLVAQGLSVPAGLTLSTSAGDDLARDGLDDALWAEVERGLSVLDAATSAPTILILRYEEVVQQRAMVTAVPTLGLCDDGVVALASSVGARFAERMYCQHIQRFAERVLEVDRGGFEELREDIRMEHGVWRDEDLGVEAFSLLRGRLLRHFECQVGFAFPQTLREQLRLALEASARFLRAEGVSTSDRALHLQRMVFADLDERSGVGVVVSRSFGRAEERPAGEFLSQQDGEALEQSLEIPAPFNGLSDSFQALMPALHSRICEVVVGLEARLKDAVEVAFVVEGGCLWFTRARRAPRSARDAVKVVVALVEEGLLTEREALHRVTPKHLNALLHPTLASSAQGEVLAVGLPASPGIVSGHIVFSTAEAIEVAAQGKPAILVKHDTHTEDIHGMQAAVGVLIATGGMTSHAAVIARGLNKPCVVGCRDLRVELEAAAIFLKGRCVRRLELLTINGGTGEILRGTAPHVNPKTLPELERLLSWADSHSTLKVRANIDRAKDALLARKLGAKGIGLCRSEHLFFERDHILEVRALLLAETPESAQEILDRLASQQRAHFESILAAMDGLPVVFRLLDPPLHEFLSQSAEELEALAEHLGATVEDLERRLQQRQEANPMLGYRGVRLGIVRPAIYEMQARAIFEATAERLKAGGDPRPEIMLPLVCAAEEVRRLGRRFEEIAEEVWAGDRAPLPYRLGAMIELPRACLVADQIAPLVGFFSFGTNDLTQMTYGISRDDTTQFLTTYLEQGVLSSDPFTTIDLDGVGVLMRLAVERGRASNSALELGLCGEHGGESQSIIYCHALGLDYVSCSPYRVPIARLVAAQAATRDMTDLTDSHALVLQSS